MIKRLSVLALGILVITSCVTRKVAVQEPSTQVQTFKVTSKDGHIIGINGVSGKGGANAGGCVATLAPGVGVLSGFYLSNGQVGCVLSDTIPGGTGACFALYINGDPYRDPSSGFGLFSFMFTTINAECTAISGGIQAGETFKVFVRSYCNADTTGSPYFDSPVTTFVVSSTFNSTCGSAVAPRKGKGHK